MRTQDDMTLPERLIHTTSIHGAYLLEVDGQLKLFRGSLIPVSLKDALSEHKVEILKLIREESK